MTERLLSALLVAALLVLVGPVAAQDAASPGRRNSELVRSIEVAAGRVQRLLAETRAGGDPTRVMCVDGRLSEIHSLLRLALERSQRANRAAELGDLSTVHRERQLLVRFAESARQLERQALECVDPEPALESGCTQVIVTIEPWVPECDVASLPTVRLPLR